MNGINIEVLEKILGKENDDSYDLYSIFEWLNLETNVRISVIKEEEQQQKEAGEPQNSTSSKMGKRKRGRPRARTSNKEENDSKPKGFKKFVLDGKTYVWFGNTCVEEGTDKYYLKRSESCQAVKRCRKKKDQEYKEICENLKKLTEENGQLLDKLNDLTQEVDNLKQILNQTFA